MIYSLRVLCLFDFSERILCPIRLKGGRPGKLTGNPSQKALKQRNLKRNRAIYLDSQGRRYPQGRPGRVAYLQRARLLGRTQMSS